MVVSKQDLAEVSDRWAKVRTALRAAGHRPIAVSAHAGSGLAELRGALRTALADAEERALHRQETEPEVRVHRFDPLDEGWQVEADGDALRVRGRRIERSAARTNFENPESRDRFQRLLERLGIDAELRRQGAVEGSTVRIGPVELEWGDE
jgi:GTP-binding protein